MTRNTTQKRQDADARLIALGDRYTEIQSRLAPLITENNRIIERALEFAKYASGIDPVEEIRPDGWMRRHEVAEKEMCRRENLRFYEKQIYALDRQMSPVMDEIMKTPACSLAGLRVKLRVAIYWNTQLWQKPNGDLDLDARSARSVIEAACAIVGLDIPKEETKRDEIANPIHLGSAALN